MSNNTVYTVHACQHGDRELHSYIVGVYSSKELAIEASGAETEWRGGKYVCEIIEWLLDNIKTPRMKGASVKSSASLRCDCKVIKMLPRCGISKE